MYDNCVLNFCLILRYIVRGRYVGGTIEGVTAATAVDVEKAGKSSDYEAVIVSLACIKNFAHLVQ